MVSPVAQSGGLAHLFYLAGATPLARRGWLVACGALLIFRLWLAVALPFTGDEAYFYWWGMAPDWGYYDHPPMVGWWLAALLGVSDATWWLRLPPLLVPLVAACLAWDLVRTAPVPPGQEAEQAGRAGIAGLLVVLLPPMVWNVAVTTDSPLIIFSSLSVWAYIRGVRSTGGRGLAWHALAGFFLGLAFLSKYFAGLLAVAYAAHVLLVRRDAQRWSGFFLLTLCSLPGPGFNFWWNSGACWPNFLFNLVNRHEDAGLNPRTTPLYLVSLLYVLTPFVPAALLRNRQQVRGVMARDAGAGAAFWLAAIPYSLFLLMSVGKMIGLHWLLSFALLVPVLAALALPTASLRRVLGWTAGLALLHGLLVIVLALLPLETWRHNRIYDGLVLTVRAPAILEKLKPYSAEYVPASDGYSNAVTLGYNARRYFMVFGIGSSHARHDDMMTDVRSLAGKHIMIVRKSPPDLADYAHYFDTVRLETIEEAGVTYYVVLGRGFHYETYRDRVLRQIKDRYYRVPAVLPLRGCYFSERYFPGEVCR